MLRCALLALGLCGSAWAADGGGISINPVRLEMAPGARAVSLSLGNDGARTRSIQIEAVRWTQVDGQDRYEPAPELVVNPPVFRVAPGASQVVRAGFRSGAPAAPVESAYRLYLQEVPDGDEPPANQLRLLLRIGVPLFVAPAAEPRVLPLWTVHRDADGSFELRLSNAGNRRIRLDSLLLSGARGQDLSLARMTYVLPGQTHRWTLPVTLEGPLRLFAMSDTGPLDVALLPP